MASQVTAPSQASEIDIDDDVFSLVPKRLNAQCDWGSANVTKSNKWVTEISHIPETDPDWAKNAVCELRRERHVGRRKRTYLENGKKVKRNLRIFLRG